MRKIKQVLQAVPVVEGAGVHLHRVFGYHNRPLFDPFLMLDDFRNDDPQNYLAGFPWHPHRGIETITYMLKGSAEHGDSMGNHGVIAEGDVQWMTAGSGIIHQEMPKPDEEGKMYGFQIWTNLPASKKMMPPRYQDIKAADIPCVKGLEDTEVKIICGQYSGIKGPVEGIVADPQYWDIYLPPETDFRIETKHYYTVLIYCYEGDLQTDGKQIRNREVVLFEPGDSIYLKSGQDGCRVLYLSGQPLQEPVAWRGPIVMNSWDEIKLAYEELVDGSFIKQSD